MMGKKVDVYQCNECQEEFYVPLDIEVMQCPYAETEDERHDFDFQIEATLKEANDE